MSADKYKFRYGDGEDDWIPYNPSVAEGLNDQLGSQSVADQSSIQQFDAQPVLSIESLGNQILDPG
jgi:hypothetical protein